MGKRSDFSRRKNDAYDTPEEAVLPVLRYLAVEGSTCFIEPCAGRGQLKDFLEAGGHDCVDAWDTEPRRGDICKADARSQGSVLYADYFITNPPWTRELLHPIIENLRKQAPTWLLFDADWMHTKQAAPYLPYCALILSVGRVKWIPDSKHTGKDNCCWYLFDRWKGETEFVGRQS